jgi:hypothetical protein
MIVVLAAGFGGSGWQPVQSDFSAQGIDDAQNIIKTQGRFPGFKFDDKAHANPCRQSQL